MFRSWISLFQPLSTRLDTVLFRLCLFTWLWSSFVVSAAPLETVAELRSLGPEEASHHVPVILKGVVTYYDHKSEDLFIQDATAGTYVSSGASTQRAANVQVGDKLRVEGTSRLGGFYTDVEATKIEKIGTEKLPEPKHVGEDELFSPSLDSQWVEIPGIVTGVERGGLAFTLALNVHGWTIKVEIPRDTFSEENARALMQKTVVLHCVAGTVFNTQQEMTGRFFYVPSFKEIIPTTLPEKDFSTPRLEVRDLLKRANTSTTLVQVVGTITQTALNGFYLRDSRDSLHVRTIDARTYPTGTVVAVDGFPAIAPFRPNLRAVKVTVLGQTTAPTPHKMTFDVSTMPLLQDDLVTVDAEMLAESINSNEFIFECRIGDRFFEAISSLNSRLPEGLSRGDHVRLTGICELTTTHPTPRIEWVDGFLLHLPMENGVTILSHAPWLTLTKALIILGIISTITLGAFLWVWQLDRVVKTQTKVIGEQIKQVAIQEERQRIGRELHDTVEQGLVGVSMQLGNIYRDVEEKPAQVSASIRLAKKMLAHCQQEARTSIRDLRSVVLEQRGLYGALQELLPDLATSSGAELQIKLSGSPSLLPANLENHLLRIAQEAVSNAARHAKASMILVHLGYSPTAATLSIRDNGCGFEPNAPVPRGHFGITGMRERVSQINAELDIESSKDGTFVRIVVPLK